MSMIIPNVEELVAKDHIYRELLKVTDWLELSKPLRNLYSKKGRKGYPVEQGFKILFLQFLEDRSDREMERYLQENLAAKYFCNFGLVDDTPDHSYFGKFRERIGTHQLANIFRRLTDSLKKAGLIREFYTFADATKIEACVDGWKARDKALADAENEETDDDGNPTMNNRNVENYSSDPDARYGAKGKGDICLGFKRHASVDMAHGLINKVTTTPANVSDGKALKHISPSQGAVVADKAYSEGEAKKHQSAKGLHSMAIKKRNAKNKNRDLDRFFSSLRMPFEGVFSKMSKRARYRGKVKVHFQVIFEAMVHNMKRLMVINAQPVPLIPI